MEPSQIRDESRCCTGYLLSRKQLVIYLLLVPWAAQNLADTGFDLFIHLLIRIMHKYPG